MHLTPVVATQTRYAPYENKYGMTDVEAVVPTPVATRRRPPLAFGHAESGHAATPAVVAESSSSVE